MISTTRSGRDSNVEVSDDVSAVFRYEHDVGLKYTVLHRIPTMLHRCRRATDASCIFDIYWRNR